MGSVTNSVMQLQVMIWLTFIFQSSLFVSPAAASTQVNIKFYTDIRCNDISKITPSAALPLNECIVTPGLVGFFLDQISCGSSSLRIYSFSDTACGKDIAWDGTDSCYSPGLNSGIAAVVVVCGDIDSNAIAQPSITHTVNDVVSQAPTSTATTLSSVRATTTLAQQPATSSGTAGTSTSNSNGGSSGWSSLSHGEQIGAIIAIAMGIPAILIAGITLCVMCRGGR